MVLYVISGLIGALTVAGTQVRERLAFLLLLHKRSAILLQPQERKSGSGKALTGEQDKDAAAAAAVSQKKKQAKKAGKGRRDAADGQDGSHKEKHAEEQKHTCF